MSVAAGVDNAGIVRLVRSRRPERGNGLQFVGRVRLWRDVCVRVRTGHQHSTVIEASLSLFKCLRKCA